MNANEQVSKFRPVTVAPLGTPCGWTAYGETGTKLTCHGDRPAIHILTETLPVAKAGTALCGFHSPYDVTEAERVAVGQPFQTHGEVGAEALAKRAEALADDRAASNFAAERAAIVSADNDDSASTNERYGQPTQVTACGTFALGETVTHAELGTGTVAYLGSAGGMEVEFDGGNTIGVDEDHYGEWSQVRTDDGPQLDCFEEAMAEAERDEMTGVDMVRELLTLEPVPTVKAPKVAVMHLGAFNGKTASGRMITERTQFTADTFKVTCKCCPRTTRFQNLYASQARKAARDVWAGAGLRTGMVVRQITTGRMGVITGLDTSIQVGYWSGDQTRSTYARLTDFDSACEIVIMADLVPVGTRLVGNLGWEGVVVAVWADEVCLQVADRPVTRMSASEFAAEISRGWLAIIPTTTVGSWR